MDEISILTSFKELYAEYKKKYRNQAAFNSLKYKKVESGEREPVFYVGVPGVIVAITMTMITIATVYLLYLPFEWYIWAPYVLAVFFAFKVAMKLDKVRQIRFMVYVLIETAIDTIEKANKNSDPEQSALFINRAKDNLEKADKWVDEPALRLQIEEIDKVLAKV